MPTVFREGAVLDVAAIMGVYERPGVASPASVASKFLVLAIEVLQHAEQRLVPAPEVAALLRGLVKHWSALHDASGEYRMDVAFLGVFFAHQEHCRALLARPRCSLCNTPQTVARLLRSEVPEMVTVWFEVVLHLCSATAMLASSAVLAPGTPAADAQTRIREVWAAAVRAGPALQQRVLDGASQLVDAHFFAADLMRRKPPTRCAKSHHVIQLVALATDRNHTKLYALALQRALLFMPLDKDVYLARVVAEGLGCVDASEKLLVDDGALVLAGAALGYLNMCHQLMAGATPLQPYATLGCLCVLEPAQAEIWRGVVFLLASYMADLVDALAPPPYTSDEGAAETLRLVKHLMVPDDEPPSTPLGRDLRAFCAKGGALRRLLP